MKKSEEIKNARKVLGITASATESEVKRIYKSLVKKWHPDINNTKQANTMMQEINKAYELIMKEIFDVIDPWEDYGRWWLNQFGNDPLWGNPTAEGHGKSKKYPGIRTSKYYIECSNNNTNTKKNLTKEFLDKNNIFAIVGVSKNPKKYGNKVYKEIKWAGYKAYPVNPRVDYIENDKCYPSLSELPKKPDVINIVVPPKIAKEVVKEAVNLGIRKVWLQPGSESPNIIRYCKKHNVSILHNICIMIERRKNLDKTK